MLFLCNISLLWKQVHFVKIKHSALRVVFSFSNVVFLFVREATSFCKVVIFCLSICCCLSIS